MIGFSNTGDTALRAWFCCAAIGTGLLCGAALGAEPVPQPPASAGTLSLTVDEATALFLKQNLDLLIAQYGIESARGLEVTARLFPNPILSVDVTGGVTLGFGAGGGLAPRDGQLFEAPGESGAPAESARAGRPTGQAAL